MYWADYERLRGTLATWEEGGDGISISSPADLERVQQVQGAQAAQASRVLEDEDAL